MKLAIGAFAGVAAAWLIPKGGVAPEAVPTPTPTRPTQLTATEVPLSTVPTGVSFRAIDGVRVFLVRNGDSVVAFHGRSTEGTGPVYWCPKNNSFEGDTGALWYSPAGEVLRFSAPRHMDRVQVLVAAGRVTIFPHVVIRGAEAPAPSIGKGPPPPPACAPAERVG